MFSYLDAGTGSMIITAIAGGIAGVGVAFKMGMQKFKRKITGKGEPETSGSDEQATTDTAN